jgi:hypothetical protein
MPGEIVTAVIVDTTLTMRASGREFVTVRVQAPGVEFPVPCDIFLTPKDNTPEQAQRCYGFARKQLAVCGWDVDAQGLDALAENPTACAGREVEVEIEDRGQYGWQGRIRVDQSLPKQRLDALTQALRGAKRKGAADLGVRRPAATAAQPEPTAAEAPGDGDEKIPF